MSDSEIIVSYRQARDREGQIKILAELNACRESDIRQVIDKYKEEHP